MARVIVSSAGEQTGSLERSSMVQVLEGELRRRASMASFFFFTRDTDCFWERGGLEEEEEEEEEDEEEEEEDEEEDEDDDEEEEEFEAESLLLGVLEGVTLGALLVALEPPAAAVTAAVTATVSPSPLAEAPRSRFTIMAGRGKEGGGGGGGGGGEEEERKAFRGRLCVEKFVKGKERWREAKDQGKGRLQCVGSIGRE